MSFIDTVKSFVTGKTPAAELKQIRERIAASEAELARLDEEIGRRALPVLKGDADAQRAVAECEAQKHEIRGRLDLLRQAEGRVAEVVAAEAAAKRRAEIEAGPE